MKIPTISVLITWTGVVGTCFGSYIVIHTHVFGGDLMRGGVSIHPGHPTQMATEGEDEAALYSHITAPQYFMATPDSSNHVRPGGLADQIIETVGKQADGIILIFKL